MSSVNRNPMLRRSDLAPVSRMLPEINEIRRSMDDVFSRWFGESPLGVFPSTTENTYQPLVDLWETPDTFMAHVSLPGVNREDLELEVTGDSVTLRGERKPVQPTENTVYHIRNIGYGRFQVSYTLPASIDTSSVKADYRDGILELTLPKVESAKTRTVKVAIEG